MSPFEEILAALVDRVPGAMAAIFVDWDGEPVATRGRTLPDLDASILGAQWGLAWREVAQLLEGRGLGGAEEAVFSLTRCTVVVRRVDEGYHLVVAVGPEGLAATAQHEAAAAARRLREEM